MKISSDLCSMHFPRNVLFFLFVLFFLPEECISNIISSTSPRAASVSKTFGSSLNSDSVWEKFLPQEYSSLIHPLRIFSSNKVPYVPLCDDFVLIQENKMSFCLDKATGKRSIMLSGDELDLTFSRFWESISIPESRFDKVPKLVIGVPFKIRGLMDARFLSPRTHYSAHIVFKVPNPLRALRYIGVAMIVHRTCEGEKWERNQLTKLKEREDGWMDAEFGEFFNEGGLLDYDEISFHIYEIDYVYWQPGFIIQGIEFQPLPNRVK